MIRDAYSAALHRERERERETTFCCIIKKTLGCLVYPGWSSFNQNLQTFMKVCVQGSIKWWHHDQPTTRCGSTMETRKQYVYNKNIGFVKPTLYIYRFFFMAFWSSGFKLGFKSNPFPVRFKHHACDWKTRWWSPEETMTKITTWR